MTTSLSSSYFPDTDMKKVSFLTLMAFALLSIFVACDKDENGVEQPQEGKMVRATFRLFAHGSGDQINIDPEFEDKVENITLAGASQNNFSVASGTASFDLQQFLGKKNLFFAANLNSADIPSVGASGSETAFNATRLNTADYLRGYGTVPATKAIPMTFTARDVFLDALNLKYKDAAGVVHPLSILRLQRAFAKVSLTLSESGGADITEILVHNIPDKFGLAAPIESYDLSSLSNLPAWSVYNSTTTPALPSQLSFYLPEKVVSNPRFYDPDNLGMMYIEVKYQNPSAPSQSHSAYYRIADPRPTSTTFGKVIRNMELRINVATSPTLSGLSVLNTSTQKTFWVN